MCHTEISYELNFFFFFWVWIYMCLVVFICLLSEHSTESRKEQACQAIELFVQ